MGSVVSSSIVREHVVVGASNRIRLSSASKHACHVHSRTHGVVGVGAGDDVRVGHHQPVLRNDEARALCMRAWMYACMHGPGMCVYYSHGHSWKPPRVCLPYTHTNLNHPHQKNTHRLRRVRGRPPPRVKADIHRDIGHRRRRRLHGVRDEVTPQPFPPVPARRPFGRGGHGGGLWVVGVWVWKEGGEGLSC